MLLPKIGFATTQQLADFYEVSYDAVEKIASRNSIELAIDGYGLYKRSELLNFLNGHEVQLESMKGKIVATMENGNEVIIPNRGLRLLPRRAVLRIGMLMKSSPITQEVRNQLLNIEEKTSVET